MLIRATTKLVGLGTLCVALASCGPQDPTDGASTPAAVEQLVGERISAKGTTTAGAGEDWFNENASGAGADVAAAYASRPVSASADEVVVAVIDSGVDIAHEDLADRIWTNPGEIPNDGVDNDDNGYVDDVHGWNYLVDANGDDIDGETLELTREFARLYKPYLASRDGTGPALSQADYDRLVKLYDEFVPKYRAAAAGSDEARYHYNWQLEQRADDQTDFSPRGGGLYGNNQVIGPDARHGTHVAGIIAAARGNGIGIDGVASHARIMVLRAVPNGDERDKDVAHAIRYAADNGARVVNMSFGKAHSRFPAKVVEAMEYAAAKGVLFVHAAGNDAKNTDTAANFPNRGTASARLLGQWIEVGASTDMGGLNLPATFSNYGATAVDLFAPGYQIRSTIPGDGYEALNGTSMAAPVVAGVAALVLTHAPELTAAEVKALILGSAKDFRTQRVYKPGTRTRVAFSTLSRTGRVVNARAAVEGL